MPAKKKDDDAKKSSGPSSLPDLKEVAGMVTKFCGDIKNSVCEIVSDYKKKRKK